MKDCRKTPHDWSSFYRNSKRKNTISRKRFNLEMAAAEMGAEVPDQIAKPEHGEE